MTRAFSYYAKNLAIMFLLVLPITSVLIGAGALAARRSFSASSLWSFIGDQLQTLYLLAWPVMALLAISYSALIHFRSVGRVSPLKRTRVFVAVGLAGLLGLLLALGGEYEARQILLSVGEYGLIGLVYGLLESRLLKPPTAPA